MKNLLASVPFKWPFPPSSKPKAPGQPSSRNVSQPFVVSRKGRVADVVMVIFWGASIPGLMWLGAAGGF